MKIIKPEKEILYVWWINFSIIMFVPILLIFIFLKNTALYISVSVWVVAFLFIFVIYLPLYYKSLVYIIENKKTTAKHGVFYIKNYTIINKQIQFMGINRSLIFRLFGLVSLQLTVPGARIILSGLDNKTARKLLHQLEGEADVLE